MSPSSGKLEWFDRQLSPHMPVAVAVHISCAIPLFMDEGPSSPKPNASRSGSARFETPTVNVEPRHAVSRREAH